jgi:hypothetical protein
MTHQAIWVQVGLGLNRASTVRKNVEATGIAHEPLPRGPRKKIAKPIPWAALVNGCRIERQTESKTLDAQIY